MAITVDFYTFSKKTNSTKQPTGTPALSASCLLKDATSIISPVFQIRTSDPTAYNYCYCRAFHRYYFISDITWNKGYWEIRCKCDVLATYKTTIGSTHGYVLRAANKSDGSIIDTLYPTDTAETLQEIYQQATSDSIAFNGFDNGYYVLGIKGANAGNVNGVIYFVLTPAKFVQVLTSFYNKMGDNTFWDNLANGIRNSIFNIDDFIESCRWYPVNILNDGGSHDVYLGSWNTGVQAPYASGTYPTAKASYFTLVPHPQARTRGSFLNYAPFTQYEICDPLVGNIRLNPDIVKRVLDRNAVDRVITRVLHIDHTTGQAKYCLCDIAGYADPFYTTYVNFSVDLNLSGSMVNVGGIISGLGNAAASLVTGDTLGAAAGIASSLALNAPQPGNNQSNGGFVQFRNPFVRAVFKNLVNEDITNKGRPLCEWNNPATLTGYMLFENPHVAVAGTAQEIDQINNYLASGFYYD